MHKLIDEGHDGFIREYDGTIYEINAFYPNQIKSATDNEGSFNPDNDDIRYSIRGGNTVGHTPDAAVSEAYENAVKDTRSKTLVGALATSLWTADGRKRFRNKFAESYFDYTRSVKALQDAIEKKAGQKIEAFEDVWKSLNQKSSIDEQEINTVNRGLIQPLMGHVAGIVKKLRKKKSALADIDSVEKYLNAKHGLERNELMARYSP